LEEEKFLFQVSVKAPKRQGSENSPLALPLPQIQPCSYRAGETEFCRFPFYRWLWFGLVTETAMRKLSQCGK